MFDVQDLYVSIQGAITKSTPVFDENLISGTTTNNGADDSTRACIPYFIVHNDLITEDQIFKIFHDADLDPEIKKVGRKGKKSYNQPETFGELKSILKVSVEL